MTPEDYDTVQSIMRKYVPAEEDMAYLDLRLDGWWTRFQIANAKEISWRPNSR
jgi:hypothetical protein